MHVFYFTLTPHNLLKQSRLAWGIIPRRFSPNLSPRLRDSVVRNVKAPNEATVLEIHV